MSTRDDIAAALVASGLDLDAKPGRPDVLHPGAAWPQWVRSTVLTGCSIERTWWVLVVLPAGSPAATDQRAEDLTPPLLDALLELGVVEVVEPVDLLVQDATGGAVPALRFTLRTSD